MIPILQFDASSLSIWYDAHLINRMRGAADIGRTFDLAMREQLEDLANHVESISDDWVKTRCGTVAAATWHEKRHFLDYIITNYGAFRVRQFFMVYCNLASVLAIARENGELLVPLQSYCDELFCDSANVKRPTPDLLAVAQDIRKRKFMLHDDRSPVRSRFGVREIGGEAILEALAHHFEIAKSQMLFGIDILERVKRDIPDVGLVAARYRWLYDILLAADLMEVGKYGEFATLRMPALVPICYAALAARLWGQKQIYSASASSYLPGYRLASLIPALQEHKETMKHGHIMHIWEVVNNVCRNIFGRTVIEEISADLGMEGTFIDGLLTRDPESLETRAYQDFHRLRRQMFEILKDNPAEILADVEYSLGLSTKLQPHVVVAASAGERGTPPPDYERLVGYEEPGRNPNDDTTRWWWAALAKGWPESDSADIYCLRDRRAWIDIISDAAPISKLLMDGRKIRTILGPEILSAEMRLRAQLDINILVDPCYAFPTGRMTAENWFYLTGYDEFRCDLTYERICKPEGVIIDPWTLRLWPSLIDYMLGRVADREGLVRTIQRDWSPWLLSEEFRELLEDLLQDTSLLAKLGRNT